MNGQSATKILSCINNMNKVQRLFRKEVKPQAIGGRNGGYLEIGSDIVCSHVKAWAVYIEWV